MLRSCVERVKSRPRLPPFEGIAFAAPPSPSVAGQLAQVYLPDMHRIEHAEPAPVLIPALPDTYTSPAQSRSKYPQLQPRTVTFQTVASESTHLGGGPSSTATAAQ